MMRYSVSFWRPSKPELGRSDPVEVSAKSVEGAICRVFGVRRLGGSPLVSVEGLAHTYSRFVKSWGAIIYFEVVPHED